MTREEAILWLNEELRTWENECQSKHPIKEALYVACKALERELNTWSLDDAREDFMHDVYNILDFLPTNDEANRIIDSFDMITKGIKQEPRWIPVSEKLPNDRDWYLGIFKEADTGWINPLPFICDYVGTETKATTKEYWILRGFTDRDERIDYYFNLECVAWMPMAEPYKAESEGEG